jgi:hypothetical protein
MTKLCQNGVLALILLAVGGCSKRDADAPEVSVATLLQALTNVHEIAEPPDGSVAMESSFDRTGGNSDWTQPRPLNADGEFILADLKGPGCVTRIWHTSVQANEWRFYFDGEAEPRVRCTSRELHGERFPFISPLCDRVSGGYYCYMPIPYAESLRVAVKAPPFTRSSRRYYHINYETYPKLTPVVSFPREFGAIESNLVNAVAGVWGDMGALLAGRFAGAEPARTHYLEPGESKSIVSLSGAGVLRAWSVGLDVPEAMDAVERSRMLRNLVVRMYWDGEDYASVVVPFGDLFCNAFHRREFAALPLGVVEGNHILAFPMPYRKGARIEIANDSAQAVEVTTRHLVGPLVEGKPIRYFHAAWAQSRSGGRPHTVLRASGEGHFVGCYLNAISMDGTWNILEGDETISVDGEMVPSWHGTGLEDYFNGAWYYTGLFDLPLHGLLEKAPIRTGQYRFHIGDRVAFDREFNMTFEFGAGNSSKGYMSSVAYWYQDRPVASPGLPIAPQRFPRRDPLEAAGMMGELFELERIGHLDEASDRCAFYATKYTGTPIGHAMKLRELAYDERLHGVDAVLAAYRGIVEQPDFPAVRQQADALLYLHAAPGNALLGTHVNAQYKLYLDGTLVAEGDDPVSLRIQPMKLSPGKHELAAEVKSVRPDAWFSMCLRSKTGDVKTDSEWERSRTRPALWPKSDDAKAMWEPVAPFGGGDMLPRMNFWKFSPNAFVEMQGARQLLRPWKAWPGVDPSSTVYLRRVFTIEN